jgi:hypothetical protein
VTSRKVPQSHATRAWLRQASVLCACLCFCCALTAEFFCCSLTCLFLAASVGACPNVCSVRHSHQGWQGSSPQLKPGNPVPLKAIQRSTPIGQISWMLQVACGPLGVTPAPESLHGSPSVDSESEPVWASESPVDDSRDMLSVS